MTTPNTEPIPATDAEIAEYKRQTTGPMRMSAGVDPMYPPLRNPMAELIARIKQEREMRRELAKTLRMAIQQCDCVDYNGKALIPCTETDPCVGCHMTRKAEALLDRAAKMEADYAK